MRSIPLIPQQSRCLQLQLISSILQAIIAAIKVLIRRLRLCSFFLKLIKKKSSLLLERKLEEEISYSEYLMENGRYKALTLEAPSISVNSDKRLSNYMFFKPESNNAVV